MSENQASADASAETNEAVQRERHLASIRAELENMASMSDQELKDIPELHFRRSILRALTV